MKRARSSSTCAGTAATLNERGVLIRCGPTPAPALLKRSLDTLKFPTDLLERYAAIYQYQRLARSEGADGKLHFW